MPRAISFNFNTTLVSVQDWRFEVGIGRAIFQYNPCIGSRWFVRSCEWHPRKFQYNPCIGSREYLAERKELMQISIQPLYRFKATLWVVTASQKLNFNTTLVSVQEAAVFWLLTLLLDFNTTLVSVQVWVWFYSPRRLGFQYNPCIGSRSSEHFTSANITPFQYNPCIGSRKTLRLTTKLLMNFNTTLVSVQVLGGLIFVVLILHFNTTLVSVQGPTSKSSRCPKFISIQPLYRFKIRKQHNPAHRRQFQYNPCIGSRSHRLVW